jgi:hypothetical protein
MTKYAAQFEPEDDEVFGLKKAIETAWDEISDQSADEVIKRTQCILGETSNTYLIKFLGEDYIIDPENRVVKTSDCDQFFNLFKIGILLHYMTNAKDIPLKNKFIGFRELWGGNEYFYAFNNRVLKPLITIFSDRPEQLIQAGQKLDGEKSDKGEVGITIPALPRVPVTVLIWGGDDEVQPSANVLFDASANEHMETEALVWLAVATVGELRKQV